MKNVFKFDGSQNIPRWIKRELGKINSEKILCLRFITEVKGVFGSHNKIRKIRGCIF